MLFLVFEVYPRVMVRREQEQEQEEEKEKVFDSLYLKDHCSSERTYDFKKLLVHLARNPYVACLLAVATKNVKELEDERPNIRASSVPPPRAVLSSPDNDGLIGNKKALFKDRSSVLKRHSLGEKTPAQENDGVIENRKLLSKERPAVLKRYSLGQKTPPEEVKGIIGERNPLVREGPSVSKKCILREATPAQSKVTPKSVKPLNPLNTRRISKETADNKSQPEEKLTPNVTVPRQKLYLRKSKLTSDDNVSSR
ncbi:hypothetical protein GIB67_024693 [Kingdonia uniflora]|uniref:Uncharacterized protein n=1 Tax=Kingdonia uniflora TaxID=39325 RepID=A0A7J7LP74_9MAGN|nr:hypothetical protein GIB67_024693 [Kingdonia uniflora]